MVGGEMLQKTWKRGRVEERFHSTVVLGVTVDSTWPISVSQEIRWPVKYPLGYVKLNMDIRLGTYLRPGRP
jgi:hypothetical protein